MTPEQWRTRVGLPIELRRGSTPIRRAADRAGISEGLWRQIESGRRVLAKGVVRTVNPKADTRVAVARALGWRDDAFAVLLAGGVPAEGAGGPVSSPGPAGGEVVAPWLVERLDRLAAGLYDTDADLQALRAEIARGSTSVLDILTKVVAKLERLEASMRRQSGPPEPRARKAQ